MRSIEESNLEESSSSKVKRWTGDQIAALRRRLSLSVQECFASLRFSMF
jgi:hypothetical protein